MALFTDYHVGKSRDQFYTTTTIEYMDWFCEQVQNDPSIDCIGFLGDWHEHRSNLPIDTMHLSFQLITKLNELNLPVYFVVGNHDLFNRHTRSVHSCVFFQQFSNLIIIDQPVIRPEFDGGALFTPFLFPTEYDASLLNQNTAHLLGHLEFKDFVITGHSIRKEHGPDCTEFSEYRRILSGHYHKRQHLRNVTYIGNTFCTSFADADDLDRGMAVYTFDSGELDFINWDGGPRYVKTTVSEIMSGNVTTPLNDHTYVKCVADVVISYEDVAQLKRNLPAQYGVRSVQVEEDKRAQKEAINETLPAGITPEDVKSFSVDDLVNKMLSQVQVDTIDPNKLVEIYRKLNPGGH